VGAWTGLSWLRIQTCGVRGSTNVTTRETQLNTEAEGGSICTAGMSDNVNVTF
jgi:hypothetical protein